jgi:hypothetical protein
MIAIIPERVIGMPGTLIGIVRNPQHLRLRVSIAYATYSGCKNLAGKFTEAFEDWPVLTKRWLVSIDFGTTEVAALQFLMALPNSEVRIPDARRVMKRRLIPAYCFHPKTYIFDNNSESFDAPCALFIGSGNLTLTWNNVSMNAWTPRCRCLICQINRLKGTTMKHPNTGRINEPYLATS